MDSTEDHEHLANTTRTWSAIIRGILTTPLATFEALAATRSWQQGVPLFMTTSLLTGLITLLRPVTSSGRSARFDAFLASPPFILANALVFYPLLVFLGAIISFRIGIKQGGIGPRDRLFTTEIFRSVVVALVSLPVTLAVAVVLRVGGESLSFVDIMLSFILGAWSWTLSVISLKASMQLSTKKAIVNILLSILIIASGGGILVCALLGLFNQSL